jgi:hypothetical protein
MSSCQECPSLQQEIQDFANLWQGLGMGTFTQLNAVRVPIYLMAVIQGHAVHA